MSQAAEAAVALFSLVCTVNDGVSYKDTYTDRGTVNVPDLSCYYKDPLDKVCYNQVTIQTIAHSYGEMILAFNDTAYNEVADILHKDMFRYFHRKTPNQQQVAYRFNEYNPIDLQRNYPHMTNRTIYAEARNCITYNQTGVDPNDPSTLTYANDTGEKGNITIPAGSLGREGTTYIYRGFHKPPDADQQSCGERCLWMWAYKNPSGHPEGSPEPTAFYKCPVNISDVSNASQHEHHIPNDVAKMAAAAIALNGGYRGPPGNATEQNYQSYRFYASG